MAKKGRKGAQASGEVSSEKPEGGHYHEPGAKCDQHPCGHHHAPGEACSHEKRECGHYHEAGENCSHEKHPCGHHHEPGASARCEHNPCGHHHAPGEACNHEMRECGHYHEAGENCTHEKHSCGHHHEPGARCDQNPCGHHHAPGEACSHEKRECGHYHETGEACKHEKHPCGHHHEPGAECEYNPSGHHHAPGEACNHEEHSCGHHHEPGEACNHEKQPSPGESCGHDHKQGSACGHHHAPGEACSHEKHDCGHYHEPGATCEHNPCGHHHAPGEACSHEKRECGHYHEAGENCAHETHECGHYHEPGARCEHNPCGHHHAPGEACHHEKQPCGHHHGPGESCGHDHKHDHHDHSTCAHDHGHQHSTSCDHGHHHHDHSSCGGHHHHHDGCCGHDHGPVKQEFTTRPAEDGGWACQFRLSDLIPGETDEHGRTEKLVDQLQGRLGITRVHVRRDQQLAELCLHYEPKEIGLEDVVAQARLSSSQVSSRYLMKSYFVRGMDSTQCAYVVEHILHRTRGVLQANVSYASERVVIEYDSQTINLKQVEARIRAAGYELEEPQKGHACSCHAHGSGLAPLLEMPLVAVSGVLLALGSMLVFTHSAGAVVPQVLFGLSIFTGGFFAVRGAWNTAMQGRLDIEALMILAAVGAGALGKFFEGGFLLFLFSLGHALEHRAMERARKSIESLGKLRPENALRKTGDKLETVPIGQLRRGDRVLVRPGDRVPMDGVIREGTSTLDQAAVTGESMPVTRTVSESVFAGTVNKDGTLEVEVTRLSGESVLARVVDMVAEAEARKGPSQLFARKVEQRFVPLALAGAPLLTVVLVIYGVPFADAVLRGISVLVAASPCALAISTPAAVLSAVARAARAGVLIKGGTHLEALGNLQAVAFDKTGTLTEGKPKVVAIQAGEGLTEETVLSVAAALENQSSHPLARAIVDEAGKRNLQVPLASQTRAILGKGLTGQLDGQSVQVGSLSMFEGQSIADWVREGVGKLQQAGRTAVIVERGGQFLGILGLADVARKDALATIKRLKALGVHKTIMLSGDNLITARAIAREVGIDDVKAPLLPEDKVVAIRDLAKETTVAMIGDGVNDAPALASASIGVAMGGAGSDVALETADIVLMADNLEALPFAVELARYSVSVIKWNLAIALGVSGLLVAASCFGWVNISEAVVLHEGSTIVVVLNGLRLLMFKGSGPTQQEGSR